MTQNLLAFACILFILTLTPEGRICTVKIQEDKLVSNGDCGVLQDNAVSRRLNRKLSDRNCDGVVYKGKCFKAIIRRKFSVPFTESERMCEGAGWKLANIYSRAHYFMIEGLLRTKFDIARNISAWTGMTMIPEEHQIVLSDGENITLSGIRWYRRYPTSDRAATHMGIDLLSGCNSDTHSEDCDKQGLWNFDPYWNGNGAVCEK